MKLSWAKDLPPGIDMQSEEEILTQIEDLAKRCGFSIVREGQMEFDLRSRADLAIETPKGLFFFEVRRKSVNDRLRIDIEARPSETYRTRHLLLSRNNGGRWQIFNDSNLLEAEAPKTVEEFQRFVDRLFESHE